MTVTCAQPDSSLGVTERLSLYLDCHARALGENGFQALAGGPVGAALLTAVITLFVAAIGYRLMFGQVPDVRDGVGWALRLGFVLALMTSWPVFQTLVYRIAVDAPQQIASTFLSATGLPAEQAQGRIQTAYDIVRIGIGAPEETGSEAGGGQTAAEVPPLLDPSPKTATLLVVSTVGLQGALKLAIGFLLALSPIAVLSLMFNVTAGLFSGWLRGLAGLAFALIGVTVVTATHLLVLEGELSRLQLFGATGLTAPDSRSATTIVVLFALVAFVMTLAGMWMASVLKLAFLPARPVPVTVRNGAPAQRSWRPVLTPERAAAAAAVESPQPGRAVVVARALSASMIRERRLEIAGPAQASPTPGSTGTVREVASTARDSDGAAAIGIAGRRPIPRRTLTAARRDKTA